MHKIAYLLKSSKILYTLYFFVMSGILRFFGLFIKCDDNLILFNCFGGKKYDDSPKSIYERMISDERFDSYKLVWALQNPSAMVLPGRATVIKSDSFKYFVTALRARVWITNSSMERGLSFKKKKTLCFNTWHGTAIKLMGIDISSDNQSFKSRALVRADIMLAQGQYDVDIFSKAFCLPSSVFRKIGLPRNDILSNYSIADVERIKNEIGIEKGKIVLLYAPTFREFTKGDSHEVVLNIPMNLGFWQERLGEKYIVLFRAHYEVAKHMKVDDHSLFIDVSSYPNLNDLMIVSDALISDYSSIYFDYSIMHKPMYCYAYDYEEYTEKRGMYIDLNNELPCQIHRREEDVIEDILQLVESRSSNIEKVKHFQEKYVTEFGTAAEKSCDLILQNLRM